MEKRIIVLAGLAIFMFATVQGRLMYLATSEEYYDQQKNNSEYILPINSTRGNIFDCNFIQLTGVEQTAYALISPSEKNYKLLFDSVADGSKKSFYKKTGKLTPFLIPIKQSSIMDADYVYYSSKRYLSLPIAQQLIGYLDNEGNGASGIEYAYNNILKDAQPSKRVRAVTNAHGQIIATIEPEILIENSSNNGIMLCIDSRIQRICEAVAIEGMDKGAIVVMESKTGRVKASVSMPTFDPSNTAASLNAANAPFINRAISQFTAGSVFKPLLAAAALENGYSEDKIYFCEGFIEVDGHVYKCAYNKGHGEVDMAKALSESCNCYFVNLGRYLGAQAVYDYAFQSGFGESTAFAGNVLTAKGNLPNTKILSNSGELANISFGQGKLTVTPSQIAAFINVFANNGIYISPSFVEAVVNKPLHQAIQSLYLPMQRIAFSSETAYKISAMLREVVDNGLAVNAKPLTGTAAGKTGTAQTGKIATNGEEYMDAWFAGYFPADNPKYTVVVLLDGGLHNSDDACTLFAQIVNSINLLNEQY